MKIEPGSKDQTTLEKKDSNQMEKSGSMDQDRKTPVTSNPYTEIVPQSTPPNGDHSTTSSCEFSSPANETRPFHEHLEAAQYGSDVGSDYAFLTTRPQVQQVNGCFKESTSLEFNSSSTTKGSGLAYQDSASDSGSAPEYAALRQAQNYSPSCMQPGTYQYNMAAYGNYGNQQSLCRTSYSNLPTMHPSYNLPSSQLPEGMAQCRMIAQAPAKLSEFQVDQSSNKRRRQASPTSHVSPGNGYQTTGATGSCNPNTDMPYHAESGTRGKTNTSGASVYLCNRDLWSRFHAHTTEMIITKQGR